MEDEILYSFKELHKLKIYPILLEYLDIEIIKKGKASYITQESLDKVLKFKEENPNTRVILQKYTFMKKYGVENPQQLKEIKDKTNQTVKEKYGVDNISQLNSIKEKKSETLQKHFGEEITNPMDCKEIVQKVKNNWKNKSQEEKDILTEKTKQTKLEKYGNENYNNGESISKTKLSRDKDDIQKEIKKLKQTKLERYGDENYNNRKKAEKTFIEKYGAKNIFASDEFIKNRKFIKSQFKKEFLEKGLYCLTDVAEIINRDYSTLKFEIIPKLQINLIEETITNGNNKYLINYNDLIKIQEYCYYTDNNGTSYYENEIIEFIKSIYNGKIIKNDRTIISPKELDIYIPQKNVAIEFNGLYWHNELRLSNDYHLNKTIACEEKGIDLIHVFEDDWRDNKEIVKSIIASRLGIYQQRIYARKCTIKEINKDLAKTFFNKNHLQSYTKCDIFLALIFNDKIVQCIGVNKKGFHDGNVELTRMVTKLNTQVVGGFSRLMKHLCKNYNFNKIISYVYKAWFNGKGYLASGFKIIKENPPSYFYIINGKRVHKSHFRKEKIKKLYENGILSYYNSNESEKENMFKNNIFCIYDCGTIKVIYEN